MTEVTLFLNSQGKLEGVTDEDERLYQGFRRKVHYLGDGLLVFQWRDPRCLKHHAKFISKIKNLLERTEAFSKEKDLRQWLTMAAGYVDWQPGPDSTPNAIPKSISFNDLDEAEFAELHRAVDGVLWSTEGLAKLWPHLSLEKQYESMQDFMRAYE